MVKKKNNNILLDDSSSNDLIDKKNDVKKNKSETNKNNKSLKDKKKNNNGTYLFIKAFIDKIKEDKLYLFSFIVTVVFLCLFSFNKLKETEGYYDKRNNNESASSTVTPTVDKDLGNDSSKNDDELDVSNYVGIYSREVTMSSPIVVDETCSITSYKLVYQIKKNKTISKYLINECLGTIKIWDDSLEYVSSGGARYISANSINYLFSANNMKEVDGETYKLDDDISTIKINEKRDDIDIVFDGDNFIISSNKDLILVKGNIISYQLSSNFKNVGGALDKIVYKSSTKNTYKFIIFSNDESKNCYTTEEISSEDFVDSELYKIYTIKYNEENDLFDSAKEVYSRNKSVGCDVYDEDLAFLEE